VGLVSPMLVTALSPVMVSDKGVEMRTTRWTTDPHAEGCRSEARFVNGGGVDSRRRSGKKWGRAYVRDHQVASAVAARHKADPRGPALNAGTLRCRPGIGVRAAGNLYAGGTSAGRQQERVLRRCDQSRGDGAGPGGTDLFGGLAREANAAAGGAALTFDPPFFFSGTVADFPSRMFGAQQAGRLSGVASRPWNVRYQFYDSWTVARVVTSMRPAVLAAAGCKIWETLFGLSTGPAA